jgi:hypothetical protein
MFLLQSEKELVDCFFSQDQKKLDLPKGVKYPLVVRDYFAWSDTSSHRVNVVFSEPDVRKPIGVVFERDRSGGAVAAICDWCHSFGSSNQIGLMMVEASAKRRVGVHLCLDLSCREKIESDLSLSPVAAQQRIRRVVERMSQFVRRILL